MREIYVAKNDEGQRIDRFLKKYLKKAPLSFIYKNLRKKNIRVGSGKTSEDYILKENDIIKLFLSDETIDKYVEPEKERKKLNKDLKVIYEDENIILINKPAGVISHNDSKKYQKNILDMMVDYLIYKKEYIPRLEKSFRPAICNRLDRNTSGIIIGAKTAQALRDINKAIRDGNINKYYITLSNGEAKGDFKDISYLSKDEDKNKVFVSKKETSGSKRSVTEFEIIKASKDYSLISVNLITGRTHQIRTVLKANKLPIVGDVKYGNKNVNEYFEKNYGYKSQFLHNYKIEFENIEGMSYLNGKSFYLTLANKEMEILNDLFGKDIEKLWMKN